MPVKPYDPTPEEIKAVCEQIQATWTDLERRVRAGSGYRRPAPYDRKRHRIRGGNHIHRSDLTGEEM